MTQARKNLLFVVCILVVSAMIPKLLWTTPSVPEPTATPATPKAAEPTATPATPKAAEPTATPATPKAAELSSEARAVQEIRAGYDRMEAAFKAKDAKAYVAVLASDYTMVSKNGEENHRAKMEASMSEAFKTLDSATFGFHVLQVSVRGQSASVQEEQTISETVHGPNPRKEKLHTMEARGKFEDTWTLTPDGWKLSKQKELSSTIKIDGKSSDWPSSNP